MKGTLVTLGIILLIIGIIGIASSYATGWMWFLVVLGVIGLLWGWSMKGKGTTTM